MATITATSSRNTTVQMAMAAMDNMRIYKYIMKMGTDINCWQFIKNTQIGSFGKYIQSKQRLKPLTCCLLYWCSTNLANKTTCYENCYIPAHLMQDIVNSMVNVCDWRLKFKQMP